MGSEATTVLANNEVHFILIILIILILLFLSALNSSLEMALAGANRIRIKSKSEAGDKKAIRAMRLIEEYEETSTTIIIFNNVVNILLATLSSAFFLSIAPVYGVALSTIIMTILILIFGEVIPKIYGKKNAERMLYSFGGFLQTSRKILNPFVIVFLFISSKFQKRLQKDDDDSIEQQEIEDEILTIIEEGSIEGTIDSEDGDLIRNAVEFNDIRVAEIMQPKNKFVSLDINASNEEILKVLKLEKYSRVPAYDADSDNIIGVLYERDFYERYTENTSFSVKTIVRDALFVPDTLKISKLLVQLRENQNHMSIIVDERGTVVGLCTIEDIIEELVGEIYDEHESVEENVKLVSDNVYLISGDLSISDFNALFDSKKCEINAQTDESTIAGYILEIAERIPEVDEKFEDEHFIYTIKSQSDKKIEKISVEKKNSEEENS